MREMNLFAGRATTTKEERQDVLRYLRKGIMELWTKDECEKLLRCREIAVRYEGPVTSAETHRSWVVPVWRFFDELGQAVLKRHSRVAFPEGAAMICRRWHEFLQAEHEAVRAWLAFMEARAFDSHVPPAALRNNLREISALQNAKDKAEGRLNQAARKLAKQFEIRAADLPAPFASRRAAPIPHILLFKSDIPA